MRYAVSDDQGVLIFRLSGFIRGSPGCYRFLDEIREYLEQRRRKRIIVDLNGATKIDSAGVGILASIVTVADRSGALLVISGMPKKIEKPIAAVRLLNVLKVLPTINDALENLKGQSVA